MNAVSPAKSVTEAPLPVLEAVAVPQAKRKSKFGRYALMLSIPAVLVIGGGYFWLSGGRYQETENANLHQARVVIAGDLTGRVTQVDFKDNQTVKAGDVLFQVDDEPYRLALAQAEAAISSARLNVEQLKAAYGLAQAQVAMAKDEVAYQTSETERQATLARRGVASTTTLDTARRDLRVAQEELATVQQSAVGALAALGGDPSAPTDAHPSIVSAVAARDRAAYNIKLTTVRAPADGVVYQAASFTTGQFVAAGIPLFSLVETGNVWVDANFKETQIANISAGQSAEVEFDIYPGKTIHATVDAIGAGTGAEFSLLPAQNATGNWVKVSQRIPVRLKLDAVDASIDLRSGMSATVTVDTGVQRSLPVMAAAN